MQNEQKQQIQSLINTWIEPGNDKRSGNKLATKIGISNATIANMKNGKWDQISDTLWNKAASFFQVKVENDGWGDFMFPETELIQDVIRHAQKHCERMCIDGPSGKSKTHTVKSMVAKDRSGELFHIICRSSMNPKTFVQEIARQVSNNIEHNNRYDTEIQIAEKLLGMNRPTLVFDETELLKITCWTSIKNIIDLTDGHVSIVLIGIDLFEIIDKNANRGKDGFKQLRRRFPIHSYEFLAEGINPSVMMDTLAKVGITNEYAQEWFIENIFDYDALKNAVLNAKRISTRNGKEIDRTFMAKYFGKRSRIVYKPNKDRA